MKCARNLDYRRLGKQRVEAYQIINIISGNTGGKTQKFGNHPAVMMWTDYVEALKLYCNCMIIEWIHRGYQNNMILYDVDPQKVEIPWFVNYQPFILSHIASLLRKDETFYSRVFVLRDDEKIFLDHGYIWPSFLTPEQITKAKNNSQISLTDFCTVIGSSAPAKYRWTIENVLAWMVTPHVNPKTKSYINMSTKNGIYNDIRNAAIQYGLIS
jgi:hypothetical protein